MIYHKAYFGFWQHKNKYMKKSVLTELNYVRFAPTVQPQNTHKDIFYLSQIKIYISRKCHNQSFNN